MTNSDLAGHESTGTGNGTEPTRRQFLAVAAALPTLSDADAIDLENGSPSPLSQPQLENVFTSAFIERYDESGTITVTAHPHPEERVAAEVLIKAEWGEAGVGLTKAEADTIGQKLLEAAKKA